MPEIGSISETISQRSIETSIFEPMRRKNIYFFHINVNSLIIAYQILQFCLILNMDEIISYIDSLLFILLHTIINSDQK